VQYPRKSCFRRKPLDLSQMPRDGVRQYVVLKRADAAQEKGRTGGCTSPRHPSSRGEGRVRAIGGRLPRNTGPGRDPVRSYAVRPVGRPEPSGNGHLATRGIATRDRCCGKKIARLLTPGRNNVPQPSIHVREEMGRLPLAARWALLTGALPGLTAALRVNPSETVQVLAVRFRPDALTRVDKSAVHVWQTPPETT
jgi:hypothetical protein